MYKAFKYRICPTDKQAAFINRHIGCCRFLYNLALETKKTAWNSNKTNLSRYDLQKQLTDLKKDVDWLKEVSADALLNSIGNLDTAYKKLFNRHCEFPKFKRKSNSGSFGIPDVHFTKDGKISIPKFREGITIILHRPVKGEIRQATVKRTPTGKYFISILCKTDDPSPVKKHISINRSVGIDLGIKTFIVGSDGSKFENPSFLRKSLSKLKYAQSRASKYKGKISIKRVAVIHEKVANQRKDFLHKTSSSLIKNHDTICIEDLNVSGMKKNRTLALSVSDAGWYEFTRQLLYKADWYGKNILSIGRFEASSKTCSVCGGINTELSLYDREWPCIDCGAIHERDLNAAINIKNFALKNLSVERRLKNQEELSTLVEVLTSED